MVDTPNCSDTVFPVETEHSCEKHGLENEPWLTWPISAALMVWSVKLIYAARRGDWLPFGVFGLVLSGSVVAFMLLSNMALFGTTIVSFVSAVVLTVAASSLYGIFSGLYRRFRTREYDTCPQCGQKMSASTPTGNS